MSDHSDGDTDSAPGDVHKKGAEKLCDAYWDLNNFRGEHEEEIAEALAQAHAAGYA